MRSTPVCQCGSCRPKVVCNWVVSRRELCGRCAGVGNALVGTGITALAQPTQAIGASAFDCLLKRLRGDTAPARTLDFLPELIVRGSTQPTS